jgi:hypothetical protein
VRRRASSDVGLAVAAVLYILPCSGLDCDCGATATAQRNHRPNRPSLRFLLLKTAKTATSSSSQPLGRGLAFGHCK